jgi:tripartite-type tricarboxylate transporter receptor subunit TctC
MVMPWPPGGGTDILGRALAARMGELLGQPVVVDNRAGGNGIIGTLEAARAKPDGYTVLMATADTHAINPAVRPALPYDALRDFAPVLWLTTQPLSLCVHPSVSAASLPEFVALAKAQPGRFTYASWGAGSTAHMAMELFQQRAGIQLTHVPYRGAAPAVSDLVAGQVQAIFTGPLTVNQMVPQGRLRCLATAAETRPPVLPDLPTFAESGYAGVSGGAWYAWWRRPACPTPCFPRSAARRRKRSRRLPSASESPASARTWWAKAARASRGTCGARSRRGGRSSKPRTSWWSSGFHGLRRDRGGRGRHGERGLLAPRPARAAGAGA